MSSSSRALLGISLCVVILSGCTRNPEQEVVHARLAVDNAMADGAEKYAPDDARRLNEHLASALAEIDKQNGRLLKDYGSAREQLTAVKNEANALLMQLPDKKSDAKKTALAAFNAAMNSFERTRSMASRVPRGGIDADLVRLETALVEAHKLIMAEDYYAAATRAADIRKRSETLAEQVQHGFPKRS